jgi:hypothetical protein
MQCRKAPARDAPRADVSSARTRAAASALGRAGSEEKFREDVHACLPRAHTPNFFPSRPNLLSSPAGSAASPPIAAARVPWRRTRLALHAKLALPVHDAIANAARGHVVIFCFFFSAGERDGVSRRRAASKRARFVLAPSIARAQLAPWFLAAEFVMEY